MLAVGRDGDGDAGPDAAGPEGAIMATELRPRSRGAAPWDESGIERGPDGVARYVDRPQSLVHLLRASVERSPAASAVVEHGGGRLTYQELWDRAARVAGGLVAAGVRRGDRVAIHLPNGGDWVLAFFGTLLAGAIAVPVNTRFRESEVAYVVEDSGSRFVFEPGALPDGRPVAVDDVGHDDLAAIFYTSGTTGFPKGAMTSHLNFLSNSETANRVIGVERDLGSDLRTLVSVPLFHVTGCNSQLIPVIELGGIVEILARYEADAFLTAVAEDRLNLLVSVPAIYFALINHPRFGEFDVGHVRWLSYGGAPIAPALVHRLMECFPNARLGNGFGQTETASIATFLPHEDAAEHPDSIGYAAPVVDLAIEGADPGSGVGELLVRGPNVVRGYWSKPEATEATFVDGWVRTGDLARIDDAGRTFLVDRAKDMINRGGENVYSVEVENALAGAPGVAESAVIGVPDDMMGEKVGAVVVPLPGARVDRQAIAAHVAGQLADFKVPQYVAVREQPLPRNAGGKILKKELREGVDWGPPLR
jgi:long-chain acyl-CoA synthetase